MGGQQPLVGAHVYVLQTNTTGYGGAGIAASSSNKSISLLTNVPGSTTLDTSGGATNGDYYVTTGAGGRFSITGDYTCTLNSEVYLYSVGGDSGSGANSAAGLLAAGNCPSGGSFPSWLYIVMNEVSTIATAYAMAGFATDALHISSSGTALAQTGIFNADANALNLENLSTGAALATTPAGNGTVPQATINTLANILASCVNSTGPGSSACSTLFADAESGGSTGTAPTDTATAAINMAHNPVANIAALYALSTATPPFAPALTAQPNDFTIAIVINGGAGSEFGFPEYVAVNASGNVWVTNEGAYCCVNGSVNEYSNTGALLNQIGYYGFGMSYPVGIAIDASGNAWTANLGGTISKLSPTGQILNPTSLSGSGFTAGGLTNGFGIAIDASGNVWAGSANSMALNGLPHDNGHGTSLVELSSSGTVMSGASGFTGGGINGPLGVAIDPAGHVWTANSGNWTVSEFNGSTGAAISPAGGYTGGGLNDPYAIIVDNGPLIWTANENNSSWSLFSDTGTA